MTKNISMKFHQTGYKNYSLQLKLQSYQLNFSVFYYIVIVCSMILNHDYDYASNIYIVE